MKLKSAPSFLNRPTSTQNQPKKFTPQHPFSLTQTRLNHHLPCPSPTFSHTATVAPSANPFRSLYLLASHPPLPILIPSSSLASETKDTRPLLHKSIMESISLLLSVHAGKKINPRTGNSPNLITANQRPVVCSFSEADVLRACAQRPLYINRPHI